MRYPVFVKMAVYLICNEHYAATSGEDWMRPDVCLEAARTPGSPSAAGRGALGVRGVAAGPERPGPTCSSAPVGSTKTAALFRAAASLTRNGDERRILLPGMP